MLAIVKQADHFDIQVGNPIAVLCQDEAKKFIKSKDPRDMYKIFMKATQIDKMSLDYSTLETDLVTMKGRLNTKKSGSSALEQDWKEAEQKYKDLQKLRDMEGKLDSLRKELIWAAVQEKEKDAEAKESEKTALVDLIRQYKIKIDKWNGKRDKITHQSRSAQEEIKTITKESETTAAKLVVAEKELKAFKAERKQEEECRKTVERELKAKEQELTSLKQLLAEQREENDEAAQANSRAELQARIDSLEQELHCLQDNKRRCNQEMDDSIAELRKISDNIQDAETTVNDRLSTLTQVKETFKNLERAQKSGCQGIGQRVARYGSVHTKLNNAIRLEKWHGSTPPLGPLGAYVELKDDESWYLAVQKALGRNQFSYACNNSEDAAKLRALIMRVAGKQAGKHIDVLTTKHEARFQVKDCLSPDLKREGIQTVEQVIAIKDDYIYNVFVNSAKIEKVALVNNGEELCRIIYKSHNDTGRISLFYTKDGDKAFPGRTTRRYYANRYIEEDRRKPKLLVKAGTDVSQALAEATEAVKRCSHDFEAAKRIKADLALQKREKEKVIGSTDRQLKQLKHHTTKTEKEIAAKTQELDSMTAANLGVDYSYYEREIVNSQAECSEKQSEIKVAHQAELAKRKAEKPFSEKKNTLKIKAQELLVKQEEAREKAAGLADKHGDAEKKIAEYTSFLEKEVTNLADKDAELEVIQKELDGEFKTADEWGVERITTAKSSATIEKHIGALGGRIKVEVGRRGDPETVTKNYKTAQKVYENAMRDIKHLDQFATYIGKILLDRLENLWQFKKQVGRLVKQEFSVSDENNNVLKVTCGEVSVQPNR